MRKRRSASLIVLTAMLASALVPMSAFAEGDEQEADLAEEPVLEEDSELGGLEEKGSGETEAESEAEPEAEADKAPEVEADEDPEVESEPEDEGLNRQSDDSSEGDEGEEELDGMTIEPLSGASDTCKDQPGFADVGNLKEGASGSWGSTTWTSVGSDGYVTLNLNDGYEIELCLKKGSSQGSNPFGAPVFKQFDGPLEGRVVQWMRDGDVKSDYSHYSYRIIGEPVVEPDPLSIDATGVCVAGDKLIVEVSGSGGEAGDEIAFKYGPRLFRLRSGSVDSGDSTYVLSRTNRWGAALVIGPEKHDKTWVTSTEDCSPRVTVAKDWPEDFDAEGLDVTFGAELNGDYYGRVQPGDTIDLAPGDTFELIAEHISETPENCEWIADYASASYTVPNLKHHNLGAFIDGLEGTVTVANSLECDEPAPPAGVRVTKTVDGEYDGNAFEFGIQCLAAEADAEHDEPLLREQFRLQDGGNRSFGPFEPGTECTVRETNAQGADTVLVNGDRGIETTVTVPERGRTSVDFVNEFDEDTPTNGGTPPTITPDVEDEEEEIQVFAEFEKTWDGFDANEELLGGVTEADLDVEFFFDGNYYAPGERFEVQLDTGYVIREEAVEGLPDACSFDSDIDDRFTTPAEAEDGTIFTIEVTNTVTCVGGEVVVPPETVEPITPTEPTEPTTPVDEVDVDDEVVTRTPRPTTDDTVAVRGEVIEATDARSLPRTGAALLWLSVIGLLGLGLGSGMLAVRRQRS